MTTNLDKSTTNEATGLTEPPAKLPSPADLPEAEIVIYDGQCSFCTKQVAMLHRWDGSDRLAFVSLHDPLVRQNYPDLTPDKMMQQLYLITRDHRRLGGAEAIRHLSTRLPRLWILAPFLNLPGTIGLWQFLYKQVAQRRYLLGGQRADLCETDACRIHDHRKK